MASFSERKISKILYYRSQLTKGISIGVLLQGRPKVQSIEGAILKIRNCDQSNQAVIWPSESYFRKIAVEWKQFDGRRGILQWGSIKCRDPLTWHLYVWNHPMSAEIFPSKLGDLDRSTQKLFRKRWLSKYSRLHHPRHARKRVVFKKKKEKWASWSC